jgi:hypothetical protein
MFRNRLATDLNPESIFILEGAGAPVSQNLAGLNQRSLYFSLTKQLRWGGGLPTESMDQSAAIAAPLVGTVEGVVRARTLSGAALAAGIPITLDGHHTVMTGFDGHYLFSGVPEGAHEVSLSTAELPAEFDPGEPTKAVVSIQPRRAARADFEVLPLSTIEGTVTGPQGSNLDGFVIRLRPGKRYTLTRSEGRFSFYNVREGDFQLVIDTATLPPNAKLLSGPSIPVSVRAGTAVPSVAFSIDTTSSPPKAIRSVLQKEYATPIHSEIEPLPDTEKPVRGASDGIAKPVVPVSHKLSDPTASEPAAVSHKLINHWASVPAAVPHKTSDPPPPVPEPVSQRVSDPAAPVPAPLSHKVINPRASAPAAASESHPYFAVAAGMFRNPEYARSMRTAMGEKFGAVRIVPLNSGGELWCVLVGNAVSQAEAQALASKVRQSNTSLRSAYVVRIDSLSPAAFTKVAPRTSAPASRPFFYDPAAPVVNDRCGVSVRHHTRSCTAVSRGPS